MKIINVKLIIKSVLIECSSHNIEMGLDHYFTFKFNNEDIIKLTQKTYDYLCNNKWDDKATNKHKTIIRKFYNKDGVVDWINEQRYSFVNKNLHDVKSYNWKMKNDPIWKDT